MSNRLCLPVDRFDLFKSPQRISSQVKTVIAKKHCSIVVKVRPKHSTIDVVGVWGVAFNKIKCKYGARIRLVEWATNVARSIPALRYQIRQIRYTIAECDVLGDANATPVVGCLSHKIVEANKHMNDRRLEKRVHCIAFFKYARADYSTTRLNGLGNIARPEPSQLGVRCLRYVILIPVCHISTSLLAGGILA
jgi:hypothetical protein